MKSGKLALQAAVPAIVGGALLWKGRMAGGIALCSIGAVVLLSGLFVPPVYRRIDQAGQALGKAVATGLTWALLVPMFILVFVPGRLVLKLRGIDPMCRAFPGREATYWVPRRPVSGADAYKRQF